MASKRAHRYSAKHRRGYAHTLSAMKNCMLGSIAPTAACAHFCACLHTHESGSVKSSLRMRPEAAVSVSAYRAPSGKETGGHLSAY